jgi:hypothetical protein
MPRWLACTVVAAFLAGCGTKPLAPPDPLRVREPGRSVKLRDPRTGIRFAAPLNWVKRIRTNPGIFRIASGAADVSGWAYPRYEKLPTTHPALETARHALIAEAKKRNRTFRLSSSRITTVKGSPAVELRGSQRILGRRIETHSIHVYRVPGEYVFEALAPRSSFATADRKVLVPLIESLEFRRR